MQAMLYLVVGVALGVALAFSEASEVSLRLAMAYGVVGLVGFLSQIIVGVEARVLPLFAWLWGFADRRHAAQPPSLHTAPARSLQAVGFYLWTGGVPLLAGGLAVDGERFVRVGAGCLCLAVILALSNVAVVLTRLWRRSPAG